MQPTEAWHRGNGSRRTGEVESPPLPDDSRINAAVEEYLALQQGEQMPNRAEFLARYPELAPALDECLAALDFLRSAAPQLNQAGAGAAPVASDECPATALGDFRILREIGRGGMGVVYEAEQLSLGRRVALKVLPFAAALDAKQLQRFKNEAQTAAHLHHTNIVPVHYVGCEQGVHFYAMQFIDGQSLAEVINALRCSAGAEAEPGPRPAAALAEELASGRWVPPRPASPAPPPAGAASPSPDGSPVPDSTAPRVQLATERSTQEPAFFRTVARLGEQAAEALDHAHQLGVIHRDIKPANLLLDVRGNLWITDFGLAQFQSEVKLTKTGDLLGTYRYMSPEQALAKRVMVDHRTDIYSLGVTLYELLTLEPACNGRDREAVLRQIAFEEPRAPRRLNKAIPVELETIVLKAMAKDPNSRYATAQELADDLCRFLEDKPIRARRPSLLQRVSRWSRRHQGLVRAGAVFLVLAVVGLAVSNLLISQERDRKGEALEGMSREKERADANLARARNAVEDYLSKVTDNPKLKAADFHALRKDLLATAVPFYEEFVKQKQDDPALEADRGRAYMKLAFVRAEMGEHEQAAADYEKARAIFARLAEDFPTVPEYHHQLARSHNYLGVQLNALGKRVEAEAAYRQALAIIEKLFADFPAVPDYRQVLASSHIKLGNVLLGQDKREAAEAAYRQALPIIEKLAADFPSVLEYFQDLAGIHNNLGLVLNGLGKRVEAEAAYRQALPISEKLAADFPAVPEYRVVLAHNHNNLGNLLRVLGKRAEAEAAHRQALAIREKLAADFPAVPAYRRDLAGDYNNLGVALRVLGKRAEAEAAYRQALAIREKLAADFPAVPEYRQQLAINYGNVGRLLSDLGQRAEAEAAHRQALAIREELAADFPAVPEYRQQLAQNHFDLGPAFLDLGKPAEAEATYRQALAICEKLVADFPTVPAYRNELARSHFFLGGVLSGLGKIDEAVAAYHHAFVSIEDLVKQFPNVPDYQRGLIKTSTNLIDLLQKHGHYEHAFVIIEDLVKQFPNVPDYQRCLIKTTTNLIDLLQKHGRYEEVEPLFRRYVDQMPKSPDAHNGLAWFLATCPDPRFRKAAEAVASAKKAVELAPKSGNWRNTLGVAHYRNGEWKEAIAELNESKILRNGLHSTAFFFLAMAHWQLGEKDEARAWYDKGVQQQNKSHSDDLRRFRAEAEALLGIEPAPLSKDKE